ncbi:MAG: ribonuclease HII [Candidatus Diapherotrites archaeon]|nr:ribonuclease HII [Candidatus Diapherotrites archaeon]
MGETAFVLIGGIDEAGRGPVIGPMVMVIAVADEEGIENLKRIGVKDSKQLKPERREKMYEEILAALKGFAVEIIRPKEIDSYVARHSLNELEAMKAADLIAEVNPRPDVVYVDSPDPYPEKYRGRIEKYLKDPPRIVAENKADVKYPIVSAASIIAKVLRDRAVREIEKEWGEFGTGYPHDERTIKQLEQILKERGDFPDFVRQSWSTARRMKERRKQRKLFDF